MAKKTKGAAGNTISHSGILSRADNKLIDAVPVQRIIFKHSTTHVPLSVISGYTKMTDRQIYTAIP
jgi:hypothetical protein